MIINKPYQWDWESRETAQDIRFQEADTLDSEHAMLLTQKDKRGRVATYKAVYLVGLLEQEKRFYPSDHGGARGARRTALQWIKTQHEGRAI